jgi:hypothetical protein
MLASVLRIYAVMHEQPDSGRSAIKNYGNCDFFNTASQWLNW